jgi:hypothetical protein
VLLETFLEIQEAHDRAPERGELAAVLRGRIQSEHRRDVKQISSCAPSVTGMASSAEKVSSDPWFSRSICFRNGGYQSESLCFFF